MTTQTIAEIAAGLSAHAWTTVNAGTDREWYGLTDRAADELEAAGLVWRPFSHDRRVLVPNALGIQLRDFLREKEAGRG